MSHLRWAKFFWQDWASDSALNLCSIPARGLWMGLLCLMSQGEPYGTLTVKGRVPSTAELYSLIAPRGTRMADFQRWLAELERNGVAHRDRRGALKSPRMHHDGTLSMQRTKAARASWNGKDEARNPRNLHVQKSGNERVLHEVDSEAESDSPHSPPKGGRVVRLDHRRKRAARGAAAVGDILHAETTDD